MNASHIACRIVCRVAYRIAIVAGATIAVLSLWSCGCKEQRTIAASGTIKWSSDLRAQTTLTATGQACEDGRYTAFTTSDASGVIVVCVLRSAGALYRVGTFQLAAVCEKLEVIERPGAGDACFANHPKPEDVKMASPIPPEGTITIRGSQEYGSAVLNLSPTWVTSSGGTKQAIIELVDLTLTWGYSACAVDDGWGGM